MLAHLLVLFLSVAACVEFYSMEGKTADPCNKYLNQVTRPDCPPHSQWPAPAVTVLIPSESSSQVTGVPSGVNLYNRKITIYGNAFPLVNTWLGLADTSDSCTSMDTGYPQAIATTNPVFPNILTFSIPAAGGAVAKTWDSQTLELEERPRLLCWSLDGVSFQYTGIKIGVVWSCVSEGSEIDSNAKCSRQTASTTNWNMLTTLQKSVRLVRTFCCKGSQSNTINAGQCINPNVQTCCGASALEITTEKCCNTTKEWVAQLDGFCPCTTTLDCPMSENCCLPTKYPELALNAAVWPNTNGYKGQCYRSNLRCCDTGSVYEPATHQCCVINGVQSANVPCPCGSNTDCTGSQLPFASRNSALMCCAQTAPTPRESSATCSKYASYPTGTASYKVQNCLGACFDARYQVCCNGVACIKDYELCCNSTCCNRWTSTCFTALRSNGASARQNWWNFGDTYTACSAVESLSTIKAFWVFVFPAILLLSAHTGMALVMVFASKSTPRSFSKLELAMMFLSVVISFLSMTLFFSPQWKYGVWIIFAQLQLFLAASARIRWLNILAIVIQFITLVYVYDPFHGNAWLTLSSNRVYGTTSAVDDVRTSGLLTSLVNSWHTAELVSKQAYCTTFYDYFSFDSAMRDFGRYDNYQITTWGYCSRGWVTALVIFSFFIMTGVLIQLTLSLMSIFFRFKEEKRAAYETDAY